MFERFTDRARRAVVLAQEEARLLHHQHIGTEHLLLGLIREGDGVAAHVLISLQIPLDVARREVEELVGRGRAAPTGHLPFTPRAKKVLELALRETLQLGHHYLGTEHLLLGLILEGDGVASRVLHRLGAEPARMRTAVLTVLSTGSLHLEPPPDVAMRPMREDEFGAWLAWSIGEYAQDLVRNHGSSPEAALQKSERDFRELLPDAVATANHWIEVAEDEAGDRVGTLWYAREARNDRETLWLYDLHVEEPYRGHGFGRRLMAVLEERARELGLTRIELNVFGHNELARTLYGSLGYRETARQMAKDLSAPDPYD